jgi:hypothetical protein
VGASVIPAKAGISDDVVLEAEPTAPSEPVTPQYTAQDALDQIDSKEYLTPWAGSGKKLYKIGVVFDYAKRNITEWEIV